MLRLIAGLEPLETGSITLDAQVLSAPKLSVPPEKRHIGMVFQNYCLFPHLSVRNNIAYGIRQRQHKKERVNEMLDLIDMQAHADRYPYQLSGGQQQRVAIAKILMQQADIILADEPIASLDPESAKSVMNTLQNIHEQDGKTVIVTLHQVDYARRYCPRTVALKQGVVQFDGVTHELSDGFLNQLYGSEMRPEDAIPVTNRPVLNPSMAAITQ